MAEIDLSTSERARGFRLKPWVKALRLHQWAKNSLLVVPALLSHTLGADALASLALAFIGLGLAASGTYVVNDVLDRADDARHPTKRRRPFASGALSPAQGWLAAATLIITGLALATYAGAGGPTAAYLLITLGYSFGLKRVVLMDAAIIGGLFTVRLWIGASAVDAPLTIWLTFFSLTVFFSLAMAKRHVELVRRAEAGDLTPLPGRDYAARDVRLTASFGIAGAIMSVVVFANYLFQTAYPSGIYARPDLLWIALAAIVAWLMRIWVLADRGRLSDDPVVFALKDRASYGLGAVAVGAVAAATFGGGAPEWLTL
ncbi:MAG: UbiA family prenyltransferase [Maricaulaceae bacterium]